MSDTLIDIFNNIIKYNGQEIVTIIDDDNIPWFYAPGIARILKYVKTDTAIRTNTNKSDRKKFLELRKFLKNPPNYMKSNAIFINESALYSLILSSKMPKAEKFRNWVTSEVLPSIRKTGSYQIEDKYRDQLDDLNNKLKEAKKEIRILRHNQKKKNYKAIGLIYVIRPIDTNKKNLLKTGKTTDFSKRLNTYNTSVPDDMDILFTLEVDDPHAVEHCMKGLLNKFVYRKNKEYYECSLKKIKDVIIKCDKLIHNEYYCEKCQANVTSINHFYDQHQFTDNDNLYFELVNNQYGGSKSLEELICIPINDQSTLKKYCQDHLYPFFDYYKTYYQCRLNEINDLLINCKESIDINQINDLTNNYDLKLSDTILIDISSIEKNENTNFIPSDEFTKQIITMEGGGFILPNGVIVYPNGKVVCPEGKIQIDNQHYQ